MPQGMRLLAPELAGQVSPVLRFGVRGREEEPMKVEGQSRNRSQELLECMDIVVKYMNDERAYERWILAVPDGADEDDFIAIAGDSEEMDHVCRLFRRIVDGYGKRGWFTYFNDGERAPIAAYGEDKEDMR